MGGHPAYIAEQPSVVIQGPFKTAASRDSDKSGIGSSEQLNEVVLILGFVTPSGEIV